MIHPDGLPTPQRYLSMLAIGLGITVAVLDSSVANIALPAITRELHAAPAAAVWVVNAYQLVIVVSLLPLASLGERVGYRRVYMAGLAVFSAGSLACALSHSLPVLVAARAAQGLGGAGIMSVNGALVRFTYPTALLGRGLGLNALVVSGAAVLGPTIAAGILSVASWPWLFAINVPIGVVNLTIAARALPHSERAARGFDWASAALNAAMFGLFFLGVDMLTQGHGRRALAWCEVAVAVGAGVALFRRGARTVAPLIPVDLLKIPVFGLSVVASVCAFTAQMLSFVALPFYFEYGLHFSQAQTGLLMTPWPVGLGIMAPVAGRLSDRMPAAVLGGVGMAILALGLGSLALLPAHAGAGAIVWRMAVCGLGFGFFQSPNNRTMLTAAPRARAGAAGGMLATARLTGMTIGATLAAVVFHLAAGGAEPVELFVATGCAVAAGGASLLRLGG